jgi:hypothetical protein
MCKQAQAPCQRGVTGGEEGAPPPVVVLGAELEVDEHRRDLGACRCEDEKHEQQREAEYQFINMEERMKKNSTKQAPMGRMPLISTCSHTSRRNIKDSKRERVGESH